MTQLLRRATVVALVGFLSVGLAACGGAATPSAQKSASGGAKSAASATAAGSQKLIPMKVGYGAYGASYADLYVAQSLGLFKKHGLNVKLVFTGGNTGLPALISGSVDIAANGGAQTMRYVSKGITDLRVIGQVVPDGYLEIWAQSYIKTPKDLIGKKFSATQPGALGDLLTRYWLKKNGIQPSQVKIVYLNGLANLVAGMESGKTAATMILPPLGEQLAAHGMHKLTDLRNLKFASHMDITTTKYIASHAAAVEDFLKATSEAVAILKTQPKTVLPILAKYTRTKNPAWNKYGYEFFKPLWAVNPLVHPSVMVATQKVLNNPAISKLNVNQYIDNSFAKKLQTSGYLATLPAK